jgi:hypothetical protein
MSDQVIVIGSFAVVYAASFGYAVYLHLRKKRAE